MIAYMLWTVLMRPSCACILCENGHKRLPYKREALAWFHHRNAQLLARSS